MNLDRPNLMLAHIQGIIDRETYEKLHASSVDKCSEGPRLSSGVRPMTDSNLVERLRDGITLGLFHPILNEAASEIQNLQARLRIAADALEELQARDDFLMKVLGMSPEDVKELLQMLEEKRKEA